MCTFVNFIVIVIFARQQLDKSIVVWLGTQIFGIAYTPRCLNGFATGSVNGALWTIFVEIQLYIVLGIVYSKLQKMNAKKWLVFLGVLSIINIAADCFTQTMNGLVPKLIERTFIPYAIWFFIGVACYKYREKILPNLKRWVVLLMIIYTVVCFIPTQIWGYYANIVVGILCPLIVIGGGYSLTAIRFKCDITYGMFLYHWIVLNVMVYLDLMNTLPWSFSLLIYLTITLLVAWLSWYFVGKRSRILIIKMLGERKD